MIDPTNFFDQKPRNLMTPDRYTAINHKDQLLIEVCSGTGFNREPIFGVSVWAGEPLNYSDDLSGLFWSLENAISHVESLTGEKVN